MKSELVLQRDDPKEIVAVAQEAISFLTRKRVQNQEEEEGTNYSPAVPRI